MAILQSTWIFNAIARREAGDADTSNIKSFPVELNKYIEDKF